jgi:hypothetical protein
MPIEAIFLFYLHLALQLVPAAVALMAARRALRSSSLYGLAYTAVFVFAVTALLAVSGGLFLERALSAGGAAMACLSAPLWALVRELCRRPAPAGFDIVIRPVFTTSRG